MKNNKFTFLGTGTSQGIPVPASNHPVSLSNNLKDKRLRTSALLDLNGTNIVIDCGPDFRYQMLRENVKHLDAILYTHEHSDHIAGLDDIRPYYFIKGSDMPVYGQKNVLEAVKTRFPYVFAENKYPGAPGVLENIVDEDDFVIDGNKITPIKVKHAELEILGYRIENLAYITDANFISDKEIEKLKNLDVLILNALRHEKHHSHFNLEEALEVSKKIGAKKTYFTHISQYLGFHDEENAKLPPNHYLAYDQLEIIF